MAKLNCWEKMKCGRALNGPKSKELGVCPAAKFPSYFDNKNEGVAGGRYCWKIAGTLCLGKVQGTFADKMKDCRKCEFYLLVKNEEGEYFVE